MPDENTPSMSAPAKDPAPTPPPTSEAPEFGTNLDDVLDRSLREAFKADGVETGSKDDSSDAPVPVEKGDEKPEETSKVPDAKKPDDDQPPVDPNTLKPPKKAYGKVLNEWNEIKKNNVRAWNALQKATEEVKKLKTALAERATTSTAEMESIKKEVEDLRGLRSVVDFEHDPEFIKTFEQPAETVKNQMVQMLQALNVSQNVIDGIDYADPGVISRVSRVLAEKADEVTANRFLKRGEEFIDLWDKREKALDEHKGNYKKFWEDRRKKAEMSGVEESARMNKRVEDVAALKDDQGNPRFPYITKMEVSPTATKAEIANIEAHNKSVELWRGKLGELINKKTPEERAEVAIAAVASAWINRQYQGALAKIKSLEETLKKYNDLSSDRGGVGPTGPTKKSGSLELEDALNESFPQFQSKI